RRRSLPVRPRRRHAARADPGARVRGAACRRHATAARPDRALRPTHLLQMDGGARLRSRHRRARLWRQPHEFRLLQLLPDRSPRGALPPARPAGRMGAVRVRAGRSHPHRRARRHRPAVPAPPRPHLLRAPTMTARLDRSDGALLAPFPPVALLGTWTRCLLAKDGAFLLSVGWLGDAWDLYFKQIATRGVSTLLAFGPAWAARSALGLSSDAYIVLAHALYFAVFLALWLAIRWVEPSRLFSRLYL